MVDFEGNSRSIEDIEVEDYVLARSEFDATGPLELKRVEEKFVRVAPVMELVVRGQVITTTAEHPFFVAGEERFVPASELTLEDQLVDSQGGSLAIDAIRVTDRLITVYNLRVADFHTYFVGGKLWQFDAWVHNAGEPYNLLRIAQVKGVKPLNSPDPQKWVDKGGNVWNELDGTWVYRDAHGNTVRYPNGYPDFEGAGVVRQKVDISQKPNRTTDFTDADTAAPLGPKLDTNTWHHHENMTTMQEIDRMIHR